MIEVSCDVGYRLKGSSEITCGSNGEWSDNSSCIYIGKHNFDIVCLKIMSYLSAPAATFV